MRCKLGAIDRAVTIAGNAKGAGDGEAGRLVVAGHHHRTDPRRDAFLNCLVDLLAWRVHLPRHAEQHRAAAELPESS